MLVATTNVPYLLPDEKDLDNCSITFDLPNDIGWVTTVIGAISELARAEIWEPDSGGLTVNEAIDTAILIRQSVVILGCTDGMQIKVGSYTGDGTDPKTITGIGFLPVFVIVWMRHSGDGNRGIGFRATPDTAAMSVNRDDEGVDYNNNIDSLDADGFSVRSAGATNEFTANESGKSYTYVAFSA